MGDGLSITGGSNGITAGYDDLLTHARLLDQIADDLGEVAVLLARVNLSPDIAGAALLCPVETADAEAALIAANLGPDGAAAACARAEASAAFLRFSVTAYREVDEIRSGVADGLAFAGGFAIGSVGLPAIVTAGAALAVAPNRDDLIKGMQQVAYDHPWIQEVFARAAPGVVEGSASALVGGNPVLLPLISGGHWPSSDLESAMKGLLAVAGTAGMLKDSGSFSVSPYGPPHAVELHRSGFVAGLLLEQSDLRDEDSAIQVITIQGATGNSYVVQIPGTQDWSPRRQGTPIDVTTDANLTAGNDTSLADAVLRAMRSAGIPPDAPVMLTGHSQGGIVAATIAADPRHHHEFNIRAVLTAGSPISRIHLPADVSVLSLEEDQDIVPKLDGRDNPDEPNWITVRRDLSQRDTAIPMADLNAAHSLDNYVQSGVLLDASTDRSVADWKSDNVSFLGRGSAQRYVVRPLAQR